MFTIHTRYTLLAAVLLLWPVSSWKLSRTAMQSKATTFYQQKKMDTKAFLSKDRTKADIRGGAASIASLGLGKLTDGPIKDFAIMIATTLVADAVARLPKYGLYASGAFAGLSMLIGFVFQHNQYVPTSDDVFTDIQGKIALATRNTIIDMLDSQHDLALTNALNGIEEQLKLYQDAIRDRDVELKIFALENLRRSFEILRTKPHLFVTSEFWKEKVPYFLLKLRGTNLCFGPRRGQKGDPEFNKRADDDEYFHVWNCSDVKYQEMLKMKQFGGQFVFASDEMTKGQYCPSHKDPEEWDNGWLFKFETPCDEKSASWSQVQAFEKKDSQQVILTSTPPKGSDGVAMLVCGNSTIFRCPGLPDEAEDRCYWAQNRNDNFEMSSKLFRKSFNQCFSVFDKVPYHPNLPTSRIRKLLHAIPKLSRLNLLGLIELHSINNEPSVCHQFNEAKKAWRSSYRALEMFYRKMPPAGDDLKWLDTLSKETYKAFKISHCKKASAALRQVALEYAQKVTAEKKRTATKKRLDFENYQRMRNDELEEQNHDFLRRSSKRFLETLRDEDKRELVDLAI